ncbi:MAG TPA: AAA family ATPase [Polyangiaceae bacterium]|jgi:RecA-family ATPase/5S rRNA maturation endonuclease (ribonuclease M5)
MTAVASEQRHRRGSPCPICGGFDEQSRGKEKRCNGFTSSDGKWAHCARVSDGAHHTNDTPAGPMFVHLLRDEPLPREGAFTTHTNGTSNGLGKPAATYLYRDERGAHLLDVCRYEPKDFRQRAPDGTWKTAGIRRVLYRLPELLASEGPVFVVEGEKDVDALRALGLVATCNPMGAGKWKHVADHAREALAGRDVIVIADRDEAGRKHAADVWASLADVAQSVVVSEVAEGKDASDWIAAGATAGDFLRLEPVTHAAPASPWDRIWTPAPDEWFTTAPPVRRWLFRDSRRDGSPGVFPLGKAGQLLAAGGVGKTMALVALARAVASGGRWLGSFACAEPGAVLLALGEEDAEECHRRLHNEARRNGAPPSGSIVVLPLHGLSCALLEQDTGGNPMETPFAGWLRERLASADFRLVVVDPMSRFAGIDAETSNRLATRYVQTIESFTSPTRSALSSHHTPLAARGKHAIEAPRARGVTAGFDGFRWECSLAAETLKLDDPAEREALGEIVTLTFTKSNYSRKPAPLTLRRDDHGALVPLDDADAQIVADARVGKADTQTKNDAKEAERARVLAKRAERDAALRAAKDAAKIEARRKQDDDDDAAVRALLAASEPPSRLRDAVCNALACGDRRAQRAIDRVRGVT